MPETILLQMPRLLGAADHAGTVFRVDARLLGWALLTGVLALIMLLPASSRGWRASGCVIGLLSLGFLLSGVLAPMVPLSEQIVFWIVAAVTIIAAVAAIATPRPVYTALWFALSLLGTAALMFLQGAQFLGVATVVVYAGAIVVMFLFVVMLAQPEGHDTYDRITWGWYTKPVSAILGAVLVSLLTFTLCAMNQTTFQRPSAGATDVLHPAHMARFGGELFGKHLLSIELAGTLLLVALVAAIAIMIHGRDPVIAPLEGPDNE